MSMFDDPLQEARANALRMATHIEQGLGCHEPEDMRSHVQEAIRFAEPARAFLEEALDSTNEERVILHGEQALEGIEEALDQANQALFSSEAGMREHIELMSGYGEQAVSHLEMAMGAEAA
jgi:hypothetical protein